MRRVNDHRQHFQLMLILAVLADCLAIKANLVDLSNNLGYSELVDANDLLLSSLMLGKPVRGGWPWRWF
eukprot:6184819-Pleurochrysis_carterae.AAC.2